MPLQSPSSPQPRWLAGWLDPLASAKAEPQRNNRRNVPFRTGKHVVCSTIQDAYFQFNFVGRILGPRGLTAKQLEQETGCKVMVRGKGSMRDKKKVCLRRF